MLNSFNPHIVAPPFANEAELLLYKSGGRSENFESLLFCTKRLAAEQILRRVPGLAGLFLGGMPIAYKLQPRLRRLRRDDLSKAKIGGIPNLAAFVPDLPGRNASGIEAVASVWPSCAVCFRRMRFACQLSLGRFGTLLHGLSSQLSGEAPPRNVISALGRGDIVSDNVSDAWIYVFLCPDSRLHHFSTNLDAQVLVERRTSVQSRNPHSDHARNVRWATEEYMRQIGEMAADGNHFPTSGYEGPEFPLAEISALDLFFDLDAELEFDLQSQVDDEVAGEPGIFGNPETYAFFGKPQCHHAPMRPFCQRVLAGNAVRMPAFFSFHPENEDAAYQIYADVTAEGYGLACKVDAY